MKIGDFRYDLPPDRIAQTPAQPRDAARLLVLKRARGTVEDARFVDLPQLLRPGDLLVVNDTRVIAARLRGRKESGGKAEVLLLRQEGARRWEALVRASKKPAPGSRIRIDEGAAVRVLEERGGGLWAVEIESADDPVRVVEGAGEMPLPPYIRRDVPDPRDRTWYQTLFAAADKGGSAAAPTAGLHFTPKVLKALAERGVERAAITLHVGLGTFLPIRVDDLDRHVMHREWFEVPAATAAAVGRAQREGRRVIAVGTTTTRVLEHCGRGGTVAAGAGWTDLFIRPGHRFRVIDGLLTNFHLPESTLLVLTCAFGGLQAVLDAYRRAVAERYRFFSYGDAMLIL